MKCSEKQAVLNQLVSQIERESSEIREESDLWMRYEESREELESMANMSDGVEKLSRKDVSTEKGLEGTIEECQVFLLSVFKSYERSEDFFLYFFFKKKS